MSSLENTYILNLIKCPISSFFLTENACFHLAENANLFVENDLINFTCIHKDDAKDENQNSNQVLPPVSFSVTLE